MSDLFFILFSAGLGSRLKTPFPKPLSPILKTTLIENNLDNIIDLLVTTNTRNFLIYINLHKEAHKIYERISKNYYWLVKRERIKFLFEHKLLGHIGTINKLKYNILRYRKLILINSDILVPNLQDHLKNIIHLPLNFIFLHKENKKNIEKTLTHFEVKKGQEFFKVINFTKELRENFVNLYTGITVVNINNFIQRLILSENFANLTFLEFLQKLINEDLWGVFIKDFFEVTSIKDLLKVNVKLLSNTIPQTKILEKLENFEIHKSL